MNKMWKHKNRLFTLVFTVFVLASCQIKPNGVLSGKKMENILTEMHQTEGALQAKGFEYNVPEVKKKYYNEILDKYGITQATFDSSLVWYTKHPKEFGMVYTKVLANLDTLNTEIGRGKFHPDDIAGMIETNLWNLRTKYKFTTDSARNAIDFEIPNTQNLTTGDAYILSFLRQIAPADSSIAPYVVLRINYLNGKKDSIYTKIHNDSLLRRITFTFQARDSLKIKSLNGTLLGVKTPKGKVIGFVDSIRLVRKFNAYQQVKIRKRIDVLDTTKLKPVEIKK